MKPSSLFGATLCLILLCVLKENIISVPTDIKYDNMFGRLEQQREAVLLLEVRGCNLSYMDLRLLPLIQQVAGDRIKHQTLVLLM